MKIETKKLQQAIKVVSDAVKKQSDDPQIVLCKDRIYVFNDELYIDYRIKLEDIENPVAVSKRLIGIVNGMSGKTTTIKINEKNNNMILKSGKAKSQISAMDFNITHIEIEMEEEAELPQNFIEGITLCSLSSLKDSTLDYEMNIGISANTINSTDGARVSEYYMEEIIDNNLIIPTSMLPVLIKNFVNTYNIDENKLYFSNGITTICIMKNMEFTEYPKCHKEFSNMSGIHIELPKKLADIITDTFVLSDTTDDAELAKNKTEIVLTPEDIIVRTQNAHGWFEKSIPNEEYMDIEEVSFFIQPMHLLEIMKETRSAVLNDNFIMFEKESFKHIIALLR